MIVATISDEMSVKRLTSPSRRTLRPTRSPRRRRPRGWALPFSSSRVDSAWYTAWGAVAGHPPAQGLFGAFVPGPEPLPSRLSG
jgi:hypothetical protein